MENVLCLGRRKVSKAMKLGQARHLELEEEVFLYDVLIDNL